MEQLARKRTKLPRVTTRKVRRRRVVKAATKQTKRKRSIRGQRKLKSSYRRLHKHRVRRHSKQHEDAALAQGLVSFEQGYQEGLIAGGEKMLVELLPGDMIIPDITAREAIAAGIQVLRQRGIPLLDPPSVFQELTEALNNKQPYSFVRLGDGELLTLAQDKVLSIDEVKKAGVFLPYAGVHVPDLAARDELAACIREATLVGVPLSRHPHFQPLLFAGLRAHGIDYNPLHFTSSTMNYSLYESGLLMELLRGRKIIIIGNVADQLRRFLVQQGIEVTGTVTPVMGFSDVPRVVAEASSLEYDIALIAAGIAAVPIAVQLTRINGKVTFDFGHLANRLAGLEHSEQE